MDKTYYHIMLDRNRLIPFIRNGRMVCFITYYLGFANEEDKFIRDNMWEVVDDNEKGNVLFIDHLITDKLKENAKLSYGIWKDFKTFVKTTYPLIKYIRWNRFNKETGKVKVYKKEIE